MRNYDKYLAETMPIVLDTCKLTYIDYLLLPVPICLNIMKYYNKKNRVKAAQRENNPIAANMGGLLEAGGEL